MEELSYGLPRALLKQDLLTPEEIAAHGVNYEEVDISALIGSLPEQRLLESLGRDGMILLPGPPKPMSLMDIRALWKNFFFMPGGEELYQDSDDAFARSDKIDALGWLACPRDFLSSHSMGLERAEQIDLVRAPWMISKVPEAVWILATYYKTRGYNLLKGGYAHAAVGFGKGGIEITECWDGRRLDSLGVAPIRKFMTLSD